ncbi:MAG: IS21 family transposase, partial [Chloroflexota bacterium]|nr:IS21 family transposase [Chloroflexota bacterium]
MERSTVHLLSKRGKSIRQIASELGRSPTTIAKVLKEPVDREAAPRHRRSGLDSLKARIEGWLGEGLSAVRMLELARGDLDEPYTGSRSQFGEYVRRVLRELEQQQASIDVPIRFEGMPAEYLQVDWGEVRNFPFTQQASSRRYFLCCRLKYSRWVWVRWTTDMRQETLLRGLVDCFVELGWVPWVLVFDNMKTVTSGRDSSGQPVWTQSLLQLAGEFGFHPQACDPGAANQKGSVESLVKWVKGSLLPGRSFADD